MVGRSGGKGEWGRGLGNRAAGEAPYSWTVTTTSSMS